MRSRPAPDDRVAEITRRRLEALTAELTAARGSGPERSPSSVGNGAASSAPPPTAASLPATEDERPGGPPEDGASLGRHARRAVPPPRRAVRWLADRIPASWQLPRTGTMHLGSAQVGVVCLVLAVGLAAGAWWLVRSGDAGPGQVVPPRVTSAGSASPAASPADSAADAAQLSAPAAAGTVPAAPAPTLSSTDGSGGPGGPGGSGGSGGESRIVVDVVGKVRRPGIVVLPAGARVADAVRAAGGMRPGVDRTLVNLARPLADGEQLLVGIPGGVSPPGAPGSGPGSGPGSVPGSAPAAPTQPGALVNLNTADQVALETLPGVGPVTAAAILEWRAENGAFSAVEELLEVRGIGDATLAEIAPHVTL